MNIGKSGSNTFLVLGLLVFALTLTFRVAFYANYYIEIETNNEVVFDWMGGEKIIEVNTNTNYWVTDKYGHVGWLNVSISGGLLHINADKNESTEDRVCNVTIKGMIIKGLMNKHVDLQVVQKGRNENNANPHARTIEDFTMFWRSFSNAPVFQKTRVKLPLTVINYDFVFDDEGDEIEKKTTSYIKEWKYENMSETEKEFEIEIQRDNDSYLVFFTHRKYDFSYMYIFNLYQGEWYLTQIHKSST